ncbi:hypothetical protein E2C01_081943 [Portunus trituberculatus]|uniref:Uncharacterized protein n=1 Tax=Portunus trituberculatus TaxID=210409 RepID=A0A5B7IT69_PORTR|nr:hypothetical protein [Portunus trituberculatus]
MVGQMPRPQLLGVVTERVPSEVHLLGLGRQPVERYTPEPDCSRWGHKEWRCQSAPRCRYCAGPHKSAQCLDKIKEDTKIPPRCCNCSTSPDQRLGDEPLLLSRCPSPVPAFLPHNWHFDYTCRVLTFATAHCYSAPCASKHSAPARQELPATDATHQLMAVVSALAAKVDNLSATVSGLSDEFVTFKNQQHTVCSGTSTVAPTLSPASSAQRGQGESKVCQHSLCDPPKKKDNAAGQCATAAAPSPRIPPSKGPHDNPRAPQGWPMLPLPQRASHLRQTVMRMLQVNGHWSATRRSAAPAQFQPGLPAPSQTRDI